MKRCSACLLVNRSSRFHGLTEEGERVLVWAKRIVADARAMRIEVRTLREGLSGQLKIAAIPTALGIVSALTAPLPRESSRRALQGLVRVLDRNLVDARQSRDRRRRHLSRQRTAWAGCGRSPLYVERYRLLTVAGNPLGDRTSVTWAEVGRIPLCLLTPDMQNRRIVEGSIREAGGAARPRWNRIPSYCFTIM